MSQCDMNQMLALARLLPKAHINCWVLPPPLLAHSRRKSATAYERTRICFAAISTLVIVPSPWSTWVRFGARSALAALSTIAK